MDILGEKMKHVRYSLTALLVAGFLAMTNAAQADTSPSTNFNPYWYVGAGILAPQKNETVFSNGTTSKVDRSTGFSGFAGYRADRYWGVEFGYYYSSIDDQDIASSGSVTSKVKGYNNHIAASLLGYVPLGNSPFTFYGRLGADYNFAMIDTNQSTPGMESHQYDAMLLYGLGFQYTVNQKISLRADYLLFGADSLMDNLSGGSSGVGQYLPRILFSATYNF